MGRQTITNRHSDRTPEFHAALQDVIMSLHVGAPAEMGQFTGGGTARPDVLERTKWAVLTITKKLQLFSQL